MTRGGGSREMTGGGGTGVGGDRKKRLGGSDRKGVVLG